MASNVKEKTCLLNLPLELRLQIFHAYFKVEGGYVYDTESDSLKTVDNRPIELSLMSTCRSIANETRHLPLSINNIRFSTLYREEWRSLAGCFNMVKSYSRILLSDFVLHIAHLMTADMLAQLALQYPKFESRLRLNMVQHQDYIAEVDEFKDLYRSGERVSSAEPGGENHAYNMRLTLCPSIDNILGMYVHEGTLESREYSSAFAALDTECTYHLRELWTGTSWEIDSGLSYCLQILADHKPIEFGNHMVKSFPCWTGERPIKEFIGLGFKPWEIPSESSILDAMRLLQLSDVWKLPNMWHYTPNWHYGDDLAINRLRNTDPYADRRDELHNSYGVRCREKIRFSAVANSIRFLQRRISADQRTHIRSLVLYEDLPSVSTPSCHMLGLAPFFKENSLLRVERHVDWLKCTGADIDNPWDVAAHFQLGWDTKGKLWKGEITLRLAHWLVDALAITDADIPAEAFTFILESGPHVDYCTDIFQRFVLRDVVWCEAFKALTLSENFDLDSSEWEQVRPILLQDEEVEALGHLMYRTSPILRCDFNTGVAWDFEEVVKDTEGLDSRGWLRVWRERFAEGDLPGRILLPSDLTYESQVANYYDIQTEDDYLRPRRIDGEETLLADG
ncbi:Ff.00g036410.m01.CDS01 [Fusarium sp. VM40]|nr:Ff.00g036410.m01.CDS01 [Fusarium sp. VM40]